MTTISPPASTSTVERLAGAAAPPGHGLASRGLSVIALRATVVTGDLLALVWGSLLAGLRGWGALLVIVVGTATVATHPGRELNPRLSSDVPALIGRLAAAMLVLAALQPLALGPAAVVRAGVLTVPFLLVWRGLTYILLRIARQRGIGLEPAVIVGAGPVGEAMARTLFNRREYGLRPIGFVDELDAASSPLPTLGSPQDLPAVLREFGTRTAVIAFGSSRESELVPVLRRCSDLPLRLYALPRFFELGMIADQRATDDVWGFPLVRLAGSPRRRVAWRVKRTTDIVVAGVALAIVSPLLLLIAAAVKLTSRGPIIFRQRRVGLLGEPIEVLKFRSMLVNDDSDTTWSVDEDDRVTRVGRILRRTHLDEVPQLINVLRGEMSLVGPRPERPHFVDQFTSEIDAYDDRHRVPTGITGWSQVNGLWGDTSIEDRARLDNHYIENWSLWKDAVILMRTIPTVLRRRPPD